MMNIDIRQNLGREMKQITAAVACLLLVGNANAYNVLIDFEDSQTQPPYTQGPDPVESQGFNFSNTLNKTVVDWPLNTVGGNNVLSWCAPEICANSNTLTMTQDGLVPFDLISLDLARLNIDRELTLIGAFAGGGTISTTVNVTSATMTTFLLGAGWTNLQSLTLNQQVLPSASEFYIHIMAVDNIAVATSVVPVPAAVWLFGSALAGLGWLGRGKTVPLS